MDSGKGVEQQQAPTCNTPPGTHHHHHSSSTGAGVDAASSSPVDQAQVRSSTDAGLGTPPCVSATAEATAETPEVAVSGSNIAPEREVHSHAPRPATSTLPVAGVVTRARAAAATAATDSELREQAGTTTGTTTPSGKMDSNMRMVLPSPAGTSSDQDNADNSGRSSAESAGGRDNIDTSSPPTTPTLSRSATDVAGTAMDLFEGGEETGGAAFAEAAASPGYDPLRPAYSPTAWPSQEGMAARTSTDHGFASGSEAAEGDNGGGTADSDAEPGSTTHTAIDITADFNKFYNLKDPRVRERHARASSASDINLSADKTPEPLRRRHSSDSLHSNDDKTSNALEALTSRLEGMDAKYDLLAHETKHQRQLLQAAMDERDAARREVQHIKHLHQRDLEIAQAQAARDTERNNELAA
jgi:hypothetical protein